MKKDRHARILEIIESREIETQEELADALRKAGYEVTQATVSRDIRDLNLTKVQIGGRSRYAALRNPDSGMTDRYVRVLREGYVSMDSAQNIIVLKTVSGMAMAVAAALDDMHISAIVGCIAGDDTIMAAIRTTEETPGVMEAIRKAAEQ